MPQNCLIIISAGLGNGTIPSGMSFAEICPVIRQLMRRMRGYTRWQRMLLLRTVREIMKKLYGYMERWKPSQNRLQIFSKISRGNLQDKSWTPSGMNTDADLFKT